MFKKKFKKNLINLLGFSLAFVFIMPIILTFFLSIMGENEINIIKDALKNKEYISFMSLIPKTFSLRQYFIIALKKPDFLNYYWNSLKIAIPIVLGQVTVGTLSAYGFSRYKFPHKNKIFLVYIITMLIPFQVTLVPNFIVALKLGTYNHFSAIYLPGIFSAFAVFYMHQYLKDIPEEIIEAARVDGANEFIIFLEIIIPIAKPYIYSLLVLSFIDSWNMIEKPIVMIAEKSKYPLPLIINSASKDSFSIIFGSAILYLIPAILIYFCSRKNLESGLKHLSLK